MTNPIRVLIIGGSGRFGSAIVESLKASANTEPVATVGRSARTPFSELPHFLNLTEALGAEKPDVVVDAATGDGLGERLEALERVSSPYVLGATGYPSPLRARLLRLGKTRAVVAAQNFSPGIAALQEALSAFRSGIAAEVWQASIVDRHHRDKLDSPSGTARLLAHALWEDGPQGEVVSLRQGDVVGEHQVYLAGHGEELVFTHRATERSVFARGAVLAVEFAHQAPAGVWSMADVLGLHLPKPR